MHPYPSHDYDNQSWMDDSYGSYAQMDRRYTQPDYSSPIIRNDQYSEQKEVVHPSVAWPILDMSNGSFLSIPPAIGNFTHITTLNLSKNKLVSLPSTIFTKLTNLTSLDVSNNEISQIPKEIENSQRLKKLILSNNSITTLPIEIGKLWRYLYLFW